MIFAFNLNTIIWITRRIFFSTRTIFVTLVILSCIWVIYRRKLSLLFFVHVHSCTLPNNFPTDFLMIPWIFCIQNQFSISWFDCQSLCTIPTITSIFLNTWSDDINGNSHTKLSHYWFEIILYESFFALNFSKDWCFFVQKRVFKSSSEMPLRKCSHFLR